MIIPEKDYKMIFRTNVTRAWCRGCHKQLKPKTARIIECVGFWNYANGLVMCDDCLKKLSNEIDELLKGNE